ncbi:porin [Rhodoferax sp.]|uniref:porin n=1 Tax=Rhodoferax sp. TaxID=50421 RepID=UPI00284F6B25|nr:porin [Rhodoferax sp.]MDR3370888.1 porin [Rhodoferax sp.]
MKKSLITLAVLATSGAAMAQSSVQLIGRIDASLARHTSEVTGYSPVASLSQTQLDDSNMQTSYWGMTGSEDLGGGLKTNFTLMSAFNVDTGSAPAGNTLFEREAHVGLAGGFGEVMLGRFYTPYHDASTADEMTGDMNYSVWFPVSSLSIGRNELRSSNGIRYNTPVYNGFSGAASYAFGENKNTAANVGNATDQVTMNVKYDTGPLMLIYGHDQEKQMQASLATAQDTKKFDTFGGTYDFGIAKLYASYQKSTLALQKTTAEQFGVDVPVSAAAKIQFGYAKGKNTGQAFDLNADGFVLAGTYDLSKRTQLYAVYNSTKIDSVDASNLGVDTTKASLLAAGVRHLF